MEKIFFDLTITKYQIGSKRFDRYKVTNISGDVQAPRETKKADIVEFDRYYYGYQTRKAY
ncbi:MAG: hypothetical protein BGN88_05460 [Clostridiales bacterium 43-6]|nr:MAG: hypothetical protein BGN88_05460 [Clostridiales bacterium 43-6]